MSFKQPTEKSSLRVKTSNVTETFRVTYNQQTISPDRRQNSRYLVSRNRCWWGDTFSINGSALNGETLFNARYTKLSKRVDIWSAPYNYHAKLLKPVSQRGMYSFELEGCKLCWDYEPDSYLRCFDTQEMSIIAQVFWGESLGLSESKFSNISLPSVRVEEYVFDVVIVTGLKNAKILAPLITLTGLLILKPWKREKQLTQDTLVKQ
ncbi:hypothetical protein K7432_005640 [Basidiobolus ranarum]|uniref:Uncharacterized protein n=1 Tax=Basidiobolus ranarum TaxID=34480 RepID=A0ABR2W2S4_9FUNG